MTKFWASGLTEHDTVAHEALSITAISPCFQSRRQSLAADLRCLFDSANIVLNQLPKPMLHDIVLWHVGITPAFSHARSLRVAPWPSHSFLHLPRRPLRLPGTAP